MPEESKDNQKLPTEEATLLDAVKEITKAVTNMAKELKGLKEEWATWRKAGKF